MGRYIVASYHSCIYFLCSQPIDSYCITAAAKSWLATCKPHRGIFKRVCGRLSNCDSVWLLPVGSGTVTAPGKPNLCGQTSCLCLWIFSVFLILCSLLLSHLSLGPVYWGKCKASSSAACRIEWCHLLWFGGHTLTPIFGLPRLKAHCVLESLALVI